MEIIKRFSNRDRDNILSKSQQCLWTDEGIKGRDYLIGSRCLDEEVIRHFGLGYVPDKIDHQLAGRIIFPIYDPSLNLVALSSRRIEEKNDFLPVYWHEAYNKTFYLYGIECAKSWMRKWNFSIVCVAGNHQCIDPKYGYKPITEFKIGDYIVSCDLESKSNKCSKILNKTFSGYKKCCKITTMNSEINLTEDHKVFVNGRWIQASDVKMGDLLLSPLGYTSSCHNDSLSAEECRLLGYFIGDGYCCGSPEFTNIDSGIISDFCDIVENVIGDRINKRDNRHYAVYGLRPRGGYKQVCNVAKSNIQLFLIKHGLYGKKSHEKTVPISVLNSSDSNMSEFLSALYDTDGSVVKNNIIYSTTSCVLASQLKSILLRFNVKASIKVVNYKNDNHKTGYLVVCCGDNSFNLAKILSFKCSYKEDRRKLILSKIKKKSSMFYPIVNYIRNLCIKNHITKKSLLYNSGVSLTTLNRKSISLEHIKKINKVLQDDFLKLLETGNFYVSEVKSNSIGIIQPVYDLEVEKTKNFYCEDILVHNCEGQFDVLQLHKHGIKNAVGLSSTNLSIIQLSLIYRYCDKIVLLLDEDANNSGQKATNKILRSMDHLMEEHDDVGQKEYANRIVSVSLGENSDPDSYLRKYGVKPLKDKIKAALRKIEL